MDTPIFSYYINGTQPPIVGNICSAFYLLQYQVDGEIIDPANVAYFEFPYGWVRLYFDGNTIFWRDAEHPKEPVNDQYSSMLVLINLSEMKGVVGSLLKSINYSADASEVRADLFFCSGKKLSFRHSGDRDATMFIG